MYENPNTPKLVFPPEQIINDDAEDGEEEDEQAPEHLAGRVAVAAEDLDQGDDVEDEDDQAAEPEAPGVSESIGQVCAAAACQKHGHHPKERGGKEAVTLGWHVSSRSVRRRFPVVYEDLRKGLGWKVGMGNGKIDA